MRTASALSLPVFCAVVGCSGATAAPAGFSLTSPAFTENARIPAEYSCDGRNVPPALHWHNVPPDAKSLAVVIDDPDAPGGGYVHWVVTGLPPSSTGIVDGALPDAAVTSLNSEGRADYFGPCPPPGAGVHHYRFQLSALSTRLALAPTTPVQDSIAAIGKAAVATARTVGIFSR